MVFRRFWLQILVRTLLLAASIFAFAFLVMESALRVTAILVLAVIVAQVASLLRYLNKVNRDLSRLFHSVRYSDFAQTFTSEGRGGAYDELSQAFNEVNQAFRQARAEKEEHFRYLQTVVQHVGIGLIALTDDGDVQLINTAAKRIFHKLKRPGAVRNIRLMSEVSPELVDTMLNLRHGEKALVKVEGDGETLELSINASEFKLRDRPFKLVSIHNIQGELEEKEMEAWQNLVRVLTHEIMNSITPISSLASTANELLADLNLSADEEESIADARVAMATIEKRSQGLMHFVDAYRNLTRIPRPKVSRFTVAELFDRVEQLLRAEQKSTGIVIRHEIDPPNLEVAADPQLIEQVLINLLTNAMQAAAHVEAPCVQLFAGIDSQSRVIFKVTDNGPGIAPEIQTKIFVPFFTTKKTGSGIGLSLSRQIMRLHGGTLSVSSASGGPTTFTMRF